MAFVRTKRVVNKKSGKVYVYKQRQASVRVPGKTNPKSVYLGRADAPGGVGLFGVDWRYTLKGDGQDWDKIEREQLAKQDREDKAREERAFSQEKFLKETATAPPTAHAAPSEPAPAPAPEQPASSPSSPSEPSETDETM